MKAQTKNTAQSGNDTQGRSFGHNVRDGYLWPSQRRYPRTVVGVRAVVAVWLIALGSFFCAYGHWWGSLLYVAAAVHVALACRLLGTGGIRVR